MHEGTHDYRYCDLPTHHPFQPSFLNQRQPPHTGTTCTLYTTYLLGVHDMYIINICHVMYVYTHDYSMHIAYCEYFLISYNTVCIGTSSFENEIDFPSYNFFIIS